jgi:hypothetical protein
MDFNIMAAGSDLGIGKNRSVRNICERGKTAPAKRAPLLTAAQRGTRHADPCAPTRFDTRRHQTRSIPATPLPVVDAILGAIDRVLPLVLPVLGTAIRTLTGAVPALFTEILLVVETIFGVIHHIVAALDTRVDAQSEQQAGLRRYSLVGHGKAGLSHSQRCDSAATQRKHTAILQVGHRGFSRIFRQKGMDSGL